MRGDVGEGFVFDTNGLHRATVEGTRQRETLVFEFNAREKSAVLKNAPCGHLDQAKSHARDSKTTAALTTGPLAAGGANLPSPHQETA